MNYSVNVLIKITCLLQEGMFQYEFTLCNECRRLTLWYWHCYNVSPSLAPTDAKLLSVLTSRPNEMSHEHWEMLCNYKFGTIVFGSPSNNQTPMPCLIGDGDLDGDGKTQRLLSGCREYRQERTHTLRFPNLCRKDYLVFWESGILSHLLHSTTPLSRKSRILLRKLTLPETKHSLVRKSNKLSSAQYDENWLSKAQQQMLDFPAQNAACSLVGALYKLCKEFSKRDDGFVDIYDENACAFARAYKDAMVSLSYFVRF